MDWRYFDAAKDQDQEHAARIWHEIGWLDRTNGQALRGMEAYTTSGRGYVSTVHSNPACFVFEASGTFRYLDDDLSFSGITGVATDRSGRKQGLALQLTARALMESAESGAAIAGLSTFEQGFYDRLGFGTGAYEHLWRFDPARLTVSDKVRPPHHLTVSDVEALHDARLGRARFHGAVTLDQEGQTRSTMLRAPNGFGLGYYDDGVETPSHGLWCGTQDTARGPYVIEFLVWKTSEQFLELMGLIKQWGDQVRLVCMSEPAGIQLQDLMDRPSQHFFSTAGGNYGSGCRVHANFQYRMLDLKACIAATHLACSPLAFNLELHDPMSGWSHATKSYSDEVPWPGLGGDYQVTVGPESEIAQGTDKSLPVLRASVGAFSRMWLGVQPASGLAITDDLNGPPALLQALGRAFRLPAPRTDWQY